MFAIAAGPSFSPRLLYASASAFSGGSPVVTVLRGLGCAAAAELRWAAGH